MAKFDAVSSRLAQRKSAEARRRRAQALQRALGVLEANPEQVTPEMVRSAHTLIRERIRRGDSKLAVRFLELVWGKPR